MLVAIGYCTKDQDQAERLAAWMADLGPYPNHRLLVARDVRAKENVFAAAGFASVEEIVITDDAWDKWPDSCNNVFRKVGKHVEFGTKEPFLWIEADVAPMREGWIDAIAAEYATCGKPFMGDRVEVEGVPLHCSGVAVYPGILSARAGLCYLAQEMAWDCMAAEQIVPQAHFTKLILHAWKHPSFTSWEMVEREILAIKPEVVLFHADKTSGLIDRLRERRNLQRANEIPTKAGALDVASEGVPEANSIGVSLDGVKIETQTATKPAPSMSLVCDIFIKTYPPDYQWLKYCLRSIAKFVSGVRRTVLVTPADVDRSWWDGSYFIDLHIDERIEYGLGNPQHDGYLSQQVFKLYADTLTDASHILFLDSDTIFTRPVTPETYFKDGRIVWMMTPWYKTNTPWQPIVEKFLGQPVNFEFMRRHPTVVPRWLLAAVREFCLEKHGMPLDQYVMSQPHRAFSEFNVLGAFAYAFHRDQFHWVNTEEVPESEWPELTVLQKFSWGGLTDEVKAEFEKILTESNDGLVSNVRIADNKTVLFDLSEVTQSTTRFFKVEQVPWESKEQSIEEIRSLAERLKNFCGNSSNVRAVRLVLHQAGVIELPYRFKRRKGKWRSKKK